MTIPRLPSYLADVPVGRSRSVRFMGVINVSPESFFQGSVRVSQGAIARLAEKLEEEGADFIDVGALSTAPYLKTAIPESLEAKRLEAAVKIIRRTSTLPISIDTSRWGPAEAGLAAGASILNDITGLARESRLADLAKNARGLILMAHPSALIDKPSANPIRTVARILKTGAEKALAAGVKRNRLTLDPGIGFFRNQSMPWWQWDVHVLRHLNQLTQLGYPLLIGVSRKSFIGQLLGQRSPQDRLAGSLAATIAAVQKGASIVRTHDIKATKDALTILKTCMN